MAKQKPKTNALGAVEARPSISVDGYSFTMGGDSEKYGAGQVTAFQGSAIAVKLSYIGFKKLMQWAERNYRVFNYQLNKELAVNKEISFLVGVDSASEESQEVHRKRQEEIKQELAQSQEQS